MKSPESLLSFDAMKDGRFVAIVDRHDKGDRDRLLSAWCVVEKTGDQYTPVSAMHYVENEKPRADLPPAKPRSIKGLGGCPFDSPDIQDLGIASVTLNIVLNDIIYAVPAQGRSAYAYAGHTWYIADNNVANYDRYMQQAAAHGLMVSAIILLRPVLNATRGRMGSRCGDIRTRIPSGIYVMPNFTTRAGVNAYAAVMNFLAERYSRPDGKFGRIHHWILHNEINSGFYWTNAGDKTLVTYLDLYQKSLPVDAVARPAIRPARQAVDLVGPLLEQERRRPRVSRPRIARSARRLQQQGGRFRMGHRVSSLRAGSVQSADMGRFAGDLRLRCAGGDI